jgi:hypothetical protein
MSDGVLSGALVWLRESLAFFPILANSMIPVSRHRLWQA